MIRKAIVKTVAFFYLLEVFSGLKGSKLISKN